MYPEITVAEYENFRPSHRNGGHNGDGRPYAFFDGHPDVDGKTRALMLIARHVKWSEQNVNTFIDQYKDQIRAPLTAQTYWTGADIVSYANLVIRVINENECV